jgi:hypothetical protein
MRPGWRSVLTPDGGVRQRRTRSMQREAMPVTAADACEG